MKVIMQPKKTYFMHKLPKYQMEDPEDYGQHYEAFFVSDEYGYRAVDFKPNPMEYGMADLQIPEYLDEFHPAKQIMDVK